MTNNVGKPIFYALVGLFGVYFLYNGIQFFSNRDKQGDTPIRDHQTYQGGRSSVTKKQSHKRNKGTKGKK